MAAVTITVDDLTPFATIEPTKAQAMIDDAVARAARIAPCILTDDFEYADAAKAVIRQAVLRWNEGGAGAKTQQTAGPFSETLNRREMFLPEEKDELRGMCSSDATGAFSIDTAPCIGSEHSLLCSLNFGATYCSCGADLAGYPLYEVDV